MIVNWIQSLGQWQLCQSQMDQSRWISLTETIISLYKGTGKEKLTLTYSMTVLSVTHSIGTLLSGTLKFSSYLCITGLCNLLSSTSALICFSKSFVRHFPWSCFSYSLLLMQNVNIHSHLHFWLYILHILHLNTVFKNDAKIAFFEELLLSRNCMHMKPKTCFII